MTTKRIKVALFALVSIIIIPIWFYFVVPAFLKIPADFSSFSKVDSFDNFYDASRKEYLGEQQSDSRFSYEAIGKEDGGLLIKNSFEVNKQEGGRIFRAERIYGINQTTGKHVPGLGDRDREGYLFAPRMNGLFAQEADKSDFDYWHVNYDVPIRMTYKDSTILYGLPVYHYFAEFSANQTKELAGTLEGVGEERGVVLDGEIELWIEPSTGQIIQYVDRAESYYFDLATGQRLDPWNKFHNNTRATSAAEQAKTLSLLRQRLFLIQYIIPAVLLILILTAWIFPLLEKIFHKNIVETHYGKKKLPGVIVVVGLTSLALTLALFFITNFISEEATESDFIAETERVSDTILDQITLYGSVVTGGRGLFDSSTEVERYEWKRYVNGLDLQANYSGIQGLGFAKKVEPEELNSFVAQIRAEGFPDFNVNPTGDREVYVPVTFIEPFDSRNQRDFGFDLMAESARRETLIDARDHGEISVSGKITLLQEDSQNKQPGFLMVAPVYKSGTSLKSLEERREALAGYVYAPFRINNFMIGVLTKHNTGLGVEIFDGYDVNDLNEERLIYKNDLVPKKPARTVVTRLSMFDHAWTIRYTASSGYGFDVFRRALPLAVLIAGLILSVFVTIFVHTVSSRKTWATMLASSMTEKLLHEEGKLSAILNSVGEGLFATDEHGKIIMVNKAFETLTGFSPQEIVGQSVYQAVPIYDSNKELIQENERPIYKSLKDKSVVETSVNGKGSLYIMRKDKSFVPVLVTSSPIIVGGELVGSVEVLTKI